jgi:hypothetical protein
MPEPKLPSDSYRKSDTPSIQETGSHIVEAHEVRITNYSGNFVVVLIVIQIPGGQSDGSESSVQESSQLLVRLLQHSIHRDLMKSRLQISAQLDAVQKSIGTP